MAKETPLLKAVRMSDYNEMVRLIKEGVDINEQGVMGVTPLHVAMSRDIKFTQQLLAASARTDIEDESGQTALHAGAKFSEISNIQLLLDAGANINAEDINSETPVDVAYKEMRKFLISQGGYSGKEKLRREEIEEARQLVWSGFLDRKEIQGRTYLSSPFSKKDRKAFKEMLKKEFVEKAEAEKEWPQETDNDRLDKVFKELNAKNIIALQNAGYTSSDAMDDINEVYVERGGEESGTIGHCFYHQQDMERAVKTGQLWLGYGSIVESDEAIAQTIIAALEKNKFVVEWDGNPETRILVTLNWQRRG